MEEEGGGEEEEDFVPSKIKKQEKRKKMENYYIKVSKYTLLPKEKLSFYIETMLRFSNMLLCWEFFIQRSSFLTSLFQLAYFHNLEELIPPLNTKTLGNFFYFYFLLFYFILFYLFLFFFFYFFIFLDIEIVCSCIPQKLSKHKDLSSTPVCKKCNNYSLTCSICRYPVRGFLHFLFQTFFFFLFNYF